MSISVHADYFQDGRSLQCYLPQTPILSPYDLPRYPCISLESRLACSPAPSTHITKVASKNNDQVVCWRLYYRICRWRLSRAKSTAEASTLECRMSLPVTFWPHSHGCCAVSCIMCRCLVSLSPGAVAAAGGLHSLPLAFDVHDLVSGHSKVQALADSDE